jgi:hypothetical protein
MKWFRSNIRLGSRLALFALTIQFLLSFGHFHAGGAQAAPALVDAKHSGLPDTASFAATHFTATHLHALDRASPANASGPVRLKTSSDHEPDGQPIDDCAICAVLALANALVVATPPCLLGPQAAAFSYLIPDVGFFRLNSRRVAFQPRAPPIS